MIDQGIAMNSVHINDNDINFCDVAQHYDSLAQHRFIHSFWSFFVEQQKINRQY
jgi:hypothetical protein